MSAEPSTATSSSLLKGWIKSIGLVTIIVGIPFLLFKMNYTKSSIALSAISSLVIIVASFNSLMDQNANLLTNCLSVDKQQAKIMLLVSMVLIVPFPVVALPMLIASSVLLLAGKCKPD
jgi:hypothetical protein